MNEYMIDAETLQRLIYKPEGLKIEFKRDFYKLHEQDYSANTPQQKVKQCIQEHWGEFIKDILSLANGNVNSAHEEGYLIIGVEDTTKALCDVGDINAKDLRQKLMVKLKKICKPALPDIHCDIITLAYNRILVISIPPSPHLHETIQSLKTPKITYQTNTVFIRRGESIGIADHAERVALLSEKQRYAGEKTTSLLTHRVWIALLVILLGFLVLIFVKLFGSRFQDTSAIWENIVINENLYNNKEGHHVIYPAISGMKSTELEAKANMLLKREILSFYKEFKENDIFSIDYTVHFKKYNLLGLLINMETTTWEAAHPYTTTATLVINLENAEIFEFKDLFRAGYKTLVDSIIITRLKEKKVYNPCQDICRCG
jgi:hypothetical protein